MGSSIGLGIEDRVLQNTHQDLVLFDGIADGGFDFSDVAGFGGKDKGVHLHSFQGEQVVAFFDALAGGNNHGGDTAGEGTGDISRSGRTRVSGSRRWGWRSGRGWSGHGRWTQGSGQRR